MKNKAFVLSLAASAVIAISALLVFGFSNSKPVSASNTGAFNVSFEGAQEDIGRLYVALAVTPAADRRAFYAQFTEHQKRGVWLLHLTLNRLSIVNPSQDEEAVFQAAISLALKTNFGDVNGNSNLLAEGKAAHNLAERVFGKGAAKRLFNDLGTAISLNGSSPATIRNVAAFVPDCGCNDYWSFCGSGKVCKVQPSHVCTTTSSGCGVLWAYPCNGECKDENAD